MMRTRTANHLTAKAAEPRAPQGRAWLTGFGSGGCGASNVLGMTVCTDRQIHPARRLVESSP